MEFDSSVYDWRMGLDSRAVWALRALGIEAGEVHGQNLRLKGAVFTFKIIKVARETAKQTIIDFLEDEYGAENIQFFASPRDSKQCYATFDMSKRQAEHEKKRG